LSRLRQYLPVAPAPGWRRSILVFYLLLSGCGSPLLQPPAQQPSRNYLLEWPGDMAQAEQSPRRDSLLVSPILSAPGFDSSDMAYMRNPHEIEYFANHRWVDAPARMLDPLLVQAVAQSGLFRHVIETGSGSDVDLRLDSRLLHLQQVCRLNPSELQLALRVTLTEVATARVVASQTFRVAEPIEARTPYAGVEAANRAVARLLSALQLFLSQHVR
jgi:cholesterol transport system auxiliary component